MLSLCLSLPPPQLPVTKRGGGAVTNYSQQRDVMRQSSFRDEGAMLSLSLSVSLPPPCFRLQNELTKWRPLLYNYVVSEPFITGKRVY